jgi:ubiquinone/menaquinone biosynthesis C-methylase UbiE
MANNKSGSGISYGSDYDEGGRGNKTVTYANMHSVNSEDLGTLVSIIDPQEKNLILDLCGGYGDVTEQLLKDIEAKGLDKGKPKDNARVILLDSSQQQLSRARANQNLSNKNNIKVLRADAVSIPVPDNHFDTIVIKMGVHDVNDQNQDLMLKEAHRVLKPGGKLVVWDLALDEHTKPLFTEIIREKNKLCGFMHLVEHRTFLTVDEMFAKLKKAGFEDTEVKHDMYPVLSLGKGRMEEYVCGHREQILRDKGVITPAEEEMLGHEARVKFAALNSYTKGVLANSDDRSRFNLTETPDDTKITVHKYILETHKNRVCATTAQR